MICQSSIANFGLIDLRPKFGCGQTYAGSAGTQGQSRVTAEGVNPTDIVTWAIFEVQSNFMTTTHFLIDRLECAHVDWGRRAASADT